MSVLLIMAVYMTVNAVLPQAAVMTLSEKDEGDGKRIVLDAGHGGYDSGKVSVTGALEKDLNLAIVYELKSILEQKGYEVILTREGDAGLYEENDRNRKRADMKKRCEIINNSNANIMVSIHHNSFTDSRVCGAQIFYYKASTDGKRLASCIQKSIRENVDNENDRVEKSNDSYYLLLNTKIPTVIAECGFLSNEKEARLLEQNDYQKKMAEAIAKGIDTYFE